MMPCPDELLLPSVPLPQLFETAQAAPPDMRWTVIALCVGIAVFLLLDIWLVKKHKLSMTNLHRKGPTWFKWFSAGALTALVWHLFFQGRKKAQTSAGEASH